MFEEEPGGSRPDRLSGVRPQERVQRHTVEQFVDAALGLRALDAPVPLVLGGLATLGLGAKRKKKKWRKKKLPKASSSRSSLLRYKVREEYPDRIMEGLSTPVESGVGPVAPFAVEFTLQYLDKVFGVPVCCYVRCNGPDSAANFRVLSGAVLGQVVVLPVMVQDKDFRPDSAENRAALGQVVVLPVVVQDRCVIETFQKLWTFRSCRSSMRGSSRSWTRLLTCPSCAMSRVCRQKTAEVVQLLFIDVKVVQFFGKVVDVLVLCNVKGFLVQTV